MDKLKMAHEYAMVRLTCGNPKTLDEIIALSWYYADAMQAEADKRNNSQPVITDQDKQRIERAYSSIVKPSIAEEWQPDWSQAPEWAEYWSINADGVGYWFENKPELMSVTWLPFDTSKANEAPSFDYQGNWKDSLRKRPTNI